VILVAGCPLLAGWVSGQTPSGPTVYNEVRVALDRTALSNLQKTVRSVLTGTAQLRGNEADIDRWYSHFFASMTQLDESRTRLADTNDLPAKRHMLHRDLRGAKNAEFHDYAVKRVLEIATKLVNPRANFHPAVRYNAMLIVGDLNQHEALLVGSEAGPAEPLGAALDVMLEALDNPLHSDAVRVAALIGILRHAELQAMMPAARRWPEGTRDRVNERVLKLAAARQPPPGRSQAGHDWMRRRAVEILSASASVGPGGSVARTLDEIVRDEQADLGLRCSAAAALGSMEYGQSAPFDPARAVRGIGMVTVDICRAELDRLDAILDAEQRDAEMAASTPSAPTDGLGAPPTRPAGGLILGEPQPTISSAEADAADTSAAHVATARRQLLYQLGCVRRGLAGGREGAGLAALATQPTARSTVEAVQSSLQTLLAVLDQPGLTMDSLTQQLAQEALRLHEALPADGDERPADDAPPDDGPPLE